MQKITPFLWFDNQAEEAAKFYVSIFKNAKLVSSNPMSATFQIDGHNYVAFNGGPMFKFNESISLFINCETQEEIDELWSKLSADGGAESRCGWVKDKYGLWWQVVPPILGAYLQDKDPVKSKRVLDAMMQMGKLDIAKLQKAYEG